MNMKTYPFPSGSFCRHKRVFLRDCYRRCPGSFCMRLIEAIQKMAHFRRLGAQIADVALIRYDFQGYSLGDSNSVALKPDYLFGIIGHEPHFSYTKVHQYLRPNSKIPQICLKPQGLVRIDRIIALILKGICLDLIEKPDSPAFMVAHVDHHSTACFSYLGHGGSQLSATIAPERAQDVSRKAFGMNPHEHFLLGAYFTFYQRQVRTFINVAGVGNNTEFSTPEG